VTDGDKKHTNAISMIKDAIKSHDTLKNKDIEFIVQGFMATIQDLNNS
jgi:hypothetical protein